MTREGLANLKLLVRNLENGYLMKKDSDGKLIQVKFDLNKPLDFHELVEAKLMNSIKLPESYESFLQTYNGGKLYNYENLDGYKLLSIDEIKRITNDVATAYEDDWLENILIFAEIIGEGNYLAFDFSRNCAILDCYHEEIPKNWSTICKDFDTWLNKLIESNGEKFWL